MQYIFLILSLELLAHAQAIAFPTCDVNSERTKRAGRIGPKTLYPEEDTLLQTTAENLNHLIFDSNKASLVQYYKSWCAHCRKYSFIYLPFTHAVEGWSDLVQFLAINCALEANDKVCVGFKLVPHLKYFPRGSKNYKDAFEVTPRHSMQEQRQDVARILAEEYIAMKYQDWPVLSVLDDSDIASVDEMFDQVSVNVSHIVLAFDDDSNDTLGIELQLDLLRLPHLVSVRISSSHSMVQQYSVNDFPYVMVFERGVSESVYSKMLTPTVIRDMRMFNRNSSENYLDDLVDILLPANTTTQEPGTTTAPDYAKLALKYFASENDLLLAIRYALLNEVAKQDEPITGLRYNALLSFVDTLRHFFPTSVRVRRNMWRLGFKCPAVLDRSNRARLFFADLFDWMVHSGSNISSKNYSNKFLEIEKNHFQPFPLNGTWHHCKGSSSLYRGYTCGLWMNFHTLTVHSFLAEAVMAENNFSPLSVLLTIRNFIDHFFGCAHCRDHFIEMADKQLNLTATVQLPSDVIMWLWRAHNRVNRRLGVPSDPTQDPQFLKYQFPAEFLCPECHFMGVGWEARTVMKYLIDYYTQIRPYKDISQGDHNYRIPDFIN